MQSRCFGAQSAIGLTIAFVMGGSLLGCSGNTPTGPTGAMQADSRGQIAIQSTRGSGSAAPSSVSWSCFARSASGTFDAQASCTTSRWSAQDVQTAAVITNAPLNLTQTVQGSTVILAWSAPAAPNQPTSYVIEAGSTAGASDITTFDTGNVATGLTVNNVPAGTYFVRVRGRDATGSGPASNEVTVVVGSVPLPPTASCPPTNLTANVVGSAVSLSWSAPAAPCQPTSYVLQAGSAAGRSDLAQVDTNGATTFGAMGLPPGTYYVRVVTRVGNQVGGASNEVVVTVGGTTPQNSTTWTGLVANGDGIVGPTDPQCGVFRSDITATFLQTGSTVTGTATVTLRSSANCPLPPITDSRPFSGTATGQLAGGSGTVTASIGTAPIAGTFTGTFANGRVTGTITFVQGGSGTFSANRVQ